MASVTFDRATCIYPDASEPSVDTLNLAIEDGEFLVLVGPSGCGKSTILRMLAGLEFVDSGSILIGDEDVTMDDPKDRDIAMVFQNYALYPHMTVAENMGFALKLAKVPKEEIRQRVEEAARLLDLTQYLDRKPKALSGGQRQRVAMGRAIVRKPRVFLMDEPLSNLDALLRVQTRAQIAELQRKLAVTTVYVTHDQVEAMTMGDRVAVLRAGKLQQVDSPRRLYDHPANAFVATFIGSPSMNMVQADVNITTTPQGDQSLAWVGETAIVLPGIPEVDGQPLETLQVGFRPERVTYAEIGTPDNAAEAGRRALPESTFYIKVDLVEELGSEAYAHGVLCTSQGTELLDAEEHPQRLTVKVEWRTPPQRGDLLTVRIGADNLHFFAPGETGVALWREDAVEAKEVTSEQ